MKALFRRHSRAVTLTELLVVVTIISLLATLAVPVYLTQIQRARVATALAEVRAIGEAQQVVALTHGFYVPIHVLNNLPNPDGSFTTTGFRDDFIGLTGRFAISATIPVTSTLSADLINPAIPTNVDPNTTSRVQLMVNTWQGPFLNPRRVVFPNETITGTTSDRSVDLVVDPWGVPYRFYTELGATGDANVPTPGNPNVQIALQWDNGRIGNQEPGRFDRFAIVSYGPNGVSDFTGNTAQFRNGDDIEFTFVGASINESAYRGF